MKRSLFMRARIFLACDLSEAVKDRALQAIEKAVARVFTGRKGFTEDFLSRHQSVWEDALAPFQGKPGVQYLEIGVYEGQSIFWMLDTILTHPDSRATGIDPLYPKYRKGFLRNLAASNAGARLKMVHFRSEKALRRLPANTYDVIYIDGSHAGRDVWLDLALAWPLLKSGGLLLVDDFLWGENVVPDVLRPGPVIELFLKTFHGEIEILSKGDQVILRKRENPLGVDYWKQSSFRRYRYDWLDGTLNDSVTGKTVNLDSVEKLALTEYLRAEGAMRAQNSEEMTKDPVLRRLCARLGVSEQDL